MGRHYAPGPAGHLWRWRLDENLGAVHLVLDGAELARISERVAKISVSGARLPEAALKMTGQQARPTMPAHPGQASQICTAQAGIVPFG